MVRSSSPPVNPSPAQSPPATGFNPCPAPTTSDCIVTLSNGARENLPAVQSNSALIVRAGTGQLGMVDNSYRFNGGTRVESGELGVGTGKNAGNSGTVLESDVYVLPSALLTVVGRVQGDVLSEGSINLWGEINGSVSNVGALLVSAAVYGNAPTIRDGFFQSSTGTLIFELAPAGWDSPAPLLVIGEARLDGTLRLSQYTDAWGPYPLPANGSQHILHANGGVFGTFAQWTSPGLFIEGGLRYGSNDVWFDLTRISVATAMAANGIDGALTLASAGNLDRALAVADGLTASPSMTQQRFLQSASQLLWMSDPRQARMSLDSLAGSAHADAMHNTQRGALAPAVGQRLATMRLGSDAGTWSRIGADGTVAGFDQWLSPRLLVGASAAEGADTSVDALGGQARRLSPQTAMYLRWFGDDGWYAGGNAGYAQHALTLDRPIDLGRGGRWNAHSQRGLGVAGLDAELGRNLSLAGGVLAPYATLSTNVVRSERALEQGSTGFELALQATTQAQLGAGLGLRYGRDWRLGETGWLRLDVDARYQRQLARGGDPLRAAFIGVPDLWFDVPGNADATSGWLDLGLRGGIGRGWNWSFAHTRPLAGGHADHAWQLGLQRRF